MSDDYVKSFLLRGRDKEKDKRTATEEKRIETLQVLVGERGDGSGKAVIHSDLEDLGKLKQQSYKIGVPPTAAEFNALQSDVQNIINLLASIAEKIK